MIVIEYLYERSIQEINFEHERRSREIDSEYERNCKEINSRFELRKYILNKNRFFKRIIILTGTVGAGKTTFANSLKGYLESLGKMVYLPQEVTIEHEQELSDYRTSLKEAIERNENVESIHVLFQQKVIEWYIDRMREISEIIDSYDYVILDRTHLDTKIFTALSVKTLFFVELLNGNLKDVTFPSGILCTIYLNPGLKNVLERQRERGRVYEDDIKYYEELYNMYDANIRDIYPDLQEFNNSCPIEEYVKYIENHMILSRF